MTSAPLQATSAPIENLAGLVERVTFHKEENGLCVLRLKVRGQRDLVTVVGHAAMIAAGEWVQAAGIWTNDRTRGLYSYCVINVGYVRVYGVARGSMDIGEASWRGRR